MLQLHAQDRQQQFTELAVLPVQSLLSEVVEACMQSGQLPTLNNAQVGLVTACLAAVLGCALKCRTGWYYYCHQGLQLCVSLLNKACNECQSMQNNYVIPLAILTTLCDRAWLICCQYIAG